MNIKKIVASTTKLLNDNSPVILTALGVTGTITTAYLAVKATFKAAEMILDEETKPPGYIKKEHKEPFDTKAKAKLVWKLYIPAVVTGAATVTCIIGANYIGTKKAAALAAAYSVSERALDEYKAKVIERVGEVEEKKIRDEIEQERQESRPLVTFLESNNDVLFLDAFSGRYFKCNKETIRRALNDINYQILHSDSASLSDFWEKIGLEPTSVSDEIGWNSEHPLEIEFSCHETPDGKACMAYEFTVVPVHNFWQV